MKESGIVENLYKLWIQDTLLLLLLDIVFFIISILSRKKTKKRKARICIYIVVFLMLVYASYPYVVDIVKKETQTIAGTVAKEIKWTSRRIGADKYFYKIVGEDGNEVTVEVTEECKEDFGLKEGENYTIEYFEFSKAVKNVYAE